MGNSLVGFLEFTHILIHILVSAFGLIHILILDYGMVFYEWYNGGLWWGIDTLQPLWVGVWYAFIWEVGSVSSLTTNGWGKFPNLVAEFVTASFWLNLLAASVWMYEQSWICSPKIMAHGNFAQVIDVLSHGKDPCEITFVDLGMAIKHG